MREICQKKRGIFFDTSLRLPKKPDTRKNRRSSTKRIPLCMAYRHSLTNFSVSEAFSKAYYLVKNGVFDPTACENASRFYISATAVAVIPYPVSAGTAGTAAGTAAVVPSPTTPKKGPKEKGKHIQTSFLYDGKRLCSIICLSFSRGADIFPEKFSYNGLR